MSNILLEVLGPASTMLKLLLENKDVQKIWLAQVLSFIGDWAALIALAGLLLDKTGSIAWSTLPTIATAGGLLIGLFVVWIGDAYSRRTVIVITDIIRAVVYGLIGVFDVPLALIAGLLIVTGLATTIFNGARGAIWQEVVMADKLQAVRSLSMVTFAATTAIGSALGAGLWQTIGAEKALLCNAVTFIISALLISRLKKTKHKPPSSRLNALAISKSIWALPNLRRIVLFSTFGSLAAETAERLVVPYAHSHIGDNFASILATTAALGSLIGTILVTRYVTRRFHGVITTKEINSRFKIGIFLQMFFYVLALLGLAMPPNLFTSIAVFACIGLFFSFAAAVQPAAISLMPARRQAGMLAMIEASNYGALLIGSTIAGISLRIYSPRIVIAWMIALTLSIFVLWYRNILRSTARA